jgi:hypothetical protein
VAQGGTLARPVSAQWDGPPLAIGAAACGRNA